MKHIVRYFQTVDPVLAAVIPSIEFPEIVPHTDYFSELCEIIINQQLSDKAAATIFGRFQALFPMKKITAKKLLTIPDTTIRSVGPSNAKVTFLKNLARAVDEKKVMLEDFPKMTDTAIIDELTKLKGIGPWSAEMFLMFSLGRPDVFSYGDLGLRHAIKRLYKFKKDPTPRQMEKIVAKWSPYRTYGARILWRSLEIDL